MHLDKPHTVRLVRFKELAGNELHLCAACVANMRTCLQRMRVCAESSTGRGPLVTMGESMQINYRAEWGVASL
jgi:hypothetical protein